MSARPQLSAPLVHLSGAVREGRRDAALESVEALLRSAGETTDKAVFDQVADLLAQAGWLADVEPLVQQMLAATDVPPGAGVLWSRLRTSAGDWDAFRDLRRWLQLGAVGDWATATWVAELVQLQDRRQLMRLLCLGEHWLGESPAAWSACAAAARQLRLYREARFWVVDWRDRAELTGDDLRQVAEILRGAGDVLAGAQANAAAIERYPDDAFRSQHECWLASDAVEAEDFITADCRLQRVDPVAFDAADRLLHTLTAAAVGVARADAPRRTEAVADALHSIAELRHATRDLRSEPARLKLYRTVLKQIASTGGFVTRWTCWWRGLV